MYVYGKRTKQIFLNLIRHKTKQKPELWRMKMGLDFMFSTIARG